MTSADLRVLANEGSFRELLQATSLLAKEKDLDPALLSRYRAYALIRTDQFRQAHSLLSRFDATKKGVEELKVDSCIKYYLAYCAYKLNQFGRALRLTLEARRRLGGSQSGSNTSLFHVIPESDIDFRLAVLQAQTLYRLGCYAEAKSLYAELRQVDASDAELATNLEACKAQDAVDSSSDSGHAHQHLEECRAMDSFAFTFNKACGLTRADDHDTANQLLDFAANQCRSGQASESERALDLARVRLQKLYLALSQEGKQAEALKLVSQLQKDADRGALDPSLSLLLRVNAFCAHERDPKKEGRSSGAIGGLASLMLTQIPSWYLDEELPARCRKLLEGTGSPAEAVRATWDGCRFSAGIAWRFSPKQATDFISNAATHYIREERFWECDKYLSQFQTSGRIPASLIQTRAILEAKRKDDGENTERPGCPNIGLCAKAANSCELFILAAAIASETPATKRRKQLSAMCRLVTPASLCGPMATYGKVKYILELIERYARSLIPTLAADFIKDEAIREATPEILLLVGQWFAKHGKLDAAALLIEDVAPERIGRDSSPLLELRLAAARCQLNYSRRQNGSAQAPDTFLTNPAFLDLKIKHQRKTAAADALMETRPGLHRRGDVRTIKHLSATLPTLAPIITTFYEKARTSRATSARKLEARPKRRRIRYPKGVDPQNPGPVPVLDPERWLPRHQRSSYKSSKRGRTFRGAQGLAVSDQPAQKVVTTAHMNISSPQKSGSRAAARGRRRGGPKH